MIDRGNSKIIEYETFKKNFDFIYLAGLKGLDRACQIQEKSTSKIFDYVEMDIKEINYFDKFVDFCEELLSFNHPNILRLIYYSRVFVEETLGDAFCKFFLIFEYSESSVENEIQHLKKSGKRFKKSTLLKIFECLISALVFFHNKNIVHGDLRTIKIMKNECGIYKIVPPRINPRQHEIPKPPQYPTQQQIIQMLKSSTALQSMQQSKSGSNKQQGQGRQSSENFFSEKNYKILQELLPQQKEEIHFIKGYRPTQNKFSKSVARFSKSQATMQKKRATEFKEHLKEEFKKDQQHYEETFYYYSPEEYEKLNFRIASEKVQIDRFKAEMFTMGMIILHIGTFQSQAGMYGKFSMKQDAIKEGLKQLRNNYGYLISEVTSRLLNFDPISRPSAKEVQVLLKDKDLNQIDRDLSMNLPSQGNDGGPAGSRLTKESTQEFDEEDEIQIMQGRNNVKGKSIISNLQNKGLQSAMLNRALVMKNKTQIVNFQQQLPSSSSQQNILIQKTVLPSLQEENISPREPNMKITPRTMLRQSTVKVDIKANESYFVRMGSSSNNNLKALNTDNSSKQHNSSQQSNSSYNESQQQLQGNGLQINIENQQVQQIQNRDFPHLQKKKQSTIFLPQSQFSFQQHQSDKNSSNGGTINLGSSQQQQQQNPSSTQVRAPIVRLNDHSRTQVRFQRKDSTSSLGIGQISKVLLSMQKLQNEAEDENDNNDKIFTTLPQEYQDEIDSKVSKHLKDIEQQCPVEFLPNGNRYQGEKVDGKPYGWGTYSWSNGEIYEGHFVEGKYSGIGIYYWPVGEKYYGEFMNGEINGLGVRFYQNGIYFGQWFKGQNHGKGTFYWPNNAKFKGFFLKDKIYGKGTLILPDEDANNEQGEERCYEGLWKDELNKGISVEKFAFQSGKL